MNREDGKIEGRGGEETSGGWGKGGRPFNASPAEIKQNIN